MRRHISVIAVSFGVVLAAACGGSSSNPGGAGSGSTSGGTSGSSSGGSSGTGTPQTIADAGVACGLTPCTGSQVCCYGSGLMPSCVDPGSCGGSTLTCSSKGDCTSGSCCFTYQYDGGTTTDGGRPATPSGFAAECQDTCDTTSFALCTTSSDCPDGDTCLPGPYARYCAAVDAGAFAIPDGGFPVMRRDASAEDGAAPSADAGADAADQ
jgi:hypothetical protein